MAMTGASAASPQWPATMLAFVKRGRQHARPWPARPGVVGFEVDDDALRVGPPIHRRGAASNSRHADARSRAAHRRGVGRHDAGLKSAIADSSFSRRYNRGVRTTSGRDEARCVPIVPRPRPGQEIGGIIKMILISAAFS